MKSLINKIKSQNFFVYFINPWERIYRQYIPKDLSQPYEEFQQTIDFLKENKVNSVLDIAMGHGRHSLKLIEEGFEVSGFDLSQSAIQKAKEIISKRFPSYDNLKFIYGDMFSQFPFKNDQFDSAIAMQAIYHGFKRNMQKSIAETARILKDGGSFIFTVSKDKSRSTVIKDELSKKRNFVFRLFHNTYLPLSGREKGLIHFYPSQHEIKSMLQQHFEHVIIADDKKNSYFIVKCKKKRKI